MVDISLRLKPDYFQEINAFSSLWDSQAKKKKRSKQGLFLLSKYLLTSAYVQGTVLSTAEHTDE